MEGLPNKRSLYERDMYERDMDMDMQVQRKGHGGGWAGGDNNYEQVVKLLKKSCSQFKSAEASTSCICCYITNGGLSKMVQKFQLWDKARLSCIHISGITIALAGSCWPRLKSFKLNYQGYRCPRNGVDEDALAIAENMPGRCHFQLFEIRITSDVLLAIPKNCPHLESFDIHQCFHAAKAGPDLSLKLFEIRGGEGSKAAQ
ncbi:hypothetical protein POM88_043863 [Heracleum sosnowskyi]|uniref:Uncharacterized protein n=1 Tax=Heracleum sosnowskyi TaxID=360622 RepID=A0AAD8M4L3_9APIA|nr:hypothetical protein POM88_043863 [Heracleum sosnowskyi]